MSRKKIQITDLNASIVGDRFTFVRLKAGLKQDEFAKYIDISKTTSSNIENHKHEPSFSAIKNIIQKFNLNPIWLLTGEGDPYIYKDTIPDDDPFKDLLLMTREILGSESEYAESLSANIKSFHRAVETEKKLVNHEKRLSNLEKKHEKHIEGDEPEYKKAANRE